MAWLISVVLMTFYLLGLFVFHAPTTIHVLPILVIVVILADYFLARRFRES